MQQKKEAVMTNETSQTQKSLKLDRCSSLSGNLKNDPKNNEITVGVNGSQA